MLSSSGVANGALPKGTIVCSPLMRRCSLLISVALASFVQHREASAERSVAIEVRTRDSSVTDSSSLSPLFDELAASGTRRWDPELVAQFEQHSSMPGRTEVGLRADFVEVSDKGYRLWTSGQFAACVVALQSLVDEAHLNPVDVAAEPRFGAALFKILVGLSLCHLRLGDTHAAHDVMSELLRSFDLEVRKAQFGVEASGLFVRTRDMQRGEAHGTLTVRSRDELAAIFLNERFAKVGQAKWGELPPGRYRVFAQVGQHQGRVHVVDVKPGQASVVEVDPAFESSVVTSARWSGLVFEDRAARTRDDVRRGARLGEELSVARVVLVGVEDLGGKRFAYGVAVDVLRRKELRRARVSLDTSTQQDGLRALGRYLMGGPRENVIETNAPAAINLSLSTTAPSEHPHQRWWGWPWLFSGAAVASIGGGVSLLVLDGNCTSAPRQGMRCPDLYDTKVAGWVLSGAGVAMGSVATWLWLSKPSAHPRETSFALSPSLAGATAWVAMPW